jgi:long-chain acyl-CoA synthetase
MRKSLGGRIRWIISGGAPLSDEVKSVLAVVFKCKIFNAYGATEAAGSSACSAAIDTRAGIVGGPLPCLGLILQEERCA